MRETWEVIVEEDSIKDFAAERGFEWQWTTAYSPWKGGIFERMVGLVK